MSCLARMVGIIVAMALSAWPAFVGAQQNERPASGNPAQARVAPAPTIGADSIAARTSDPQRKPLDLRAPDITKLFSQQELQRLLAKTVDPDIEEVEVEGARDRAVRPPDTPTAWPGILAPFWALTHPTQAWRIFAPLPPDQAQRIGSTPPDATDPYRPPPPLP
jgi:hypothetical protein